MLEVFLLIVAVYCILYLGKVVGDSFNFKPFPRCEYGYCYRTSRVSVSFLCPDCSNYSTTFKSCHHHVNDITTECPCGADMISFTMNNRSAKRLTKIGN